MIPRRHLVLIGLPGAGKTTVAEVVAEMLGTDAHDLDRTILEGVSEDSIEEIFEVRGEPEFRRLERLAMDSLLRLESSIIAAGGGWAAHGDNMLASESRAFIIYLAVPIEVAAERLGDGEGRPLLSGGTLEALRRLEVERRPHYRRAGIEIEASASPELVAAAVVTSARQYAGW